LREKEFGIAGAFEVEAVRVNLILALGLRRLKMVPLAISDLSGKFKSAVRLCMTRRSFCKIL